MAEYVAAADVCQSATTCCTVHRQQASRSQNEHLTSNHGSAMQTRQQRAPASTCRVNMSLLSAAQVVQLQQEQVALWPSIDLCHNLKQGTMILLAS